MPLPPLFLVFNRTGAIPNELCNIQGLENLSLARNQLEGDTSCFLFFWVHPNVNISVAPNHTQCAIIGCRSSPWCDMTLVLRLINSLVTDLNYQPRCSCHTLVTGCIPEYIGKFTALRVLDLSVNRLTGEDFGLYSVWKKGGSSPLLATAYTLEGWGIHGV